MVKIISIVKILKSGIPKIINDKIISVKIGKIIQKNLFQM